MRASAQTTILLLAYSVGAGTSLSIALLAGNRVFNALKRSLGAEVWIRRILGAGVIAGVIGGVSAWTVVCSRSFRWRARPSRASLVDRLQPKKQAPAMMMMSGANPGKSAGPEMMPELAGATEWINSKPLNRDDLKGHVVLVDFWTYSCINCLRTLPYIRAWADRYKDSGLIVLGVHTPEFAFEKDSDNVRRAVKELNIAYPVVLDNDYAIWKAFSNKFWPADYLVDVMGKIRHTHFGEGKYDETEKNIQDLLKERDGHLSFDNSVKITSSGVEAPPDSDVQSPETYVGYDMETPSFLPAASARI